MWHHYSAIIVVVFFTSLILFGVFFILNLFLAVISDSFESVNEEERKKEMIQEKILRSIKLQQSSMMLKDELTLEKIPALDKT